MPNYIAVVTDAGRAKIATNIAQGVPVQIPTCAVGDGGGTDYTPNTDMTALVNQTWSGMVNLVQQNSTDSDILDVRIVIPADVGGFTVRETGLFDETGSLLAIASVPAITKSIATQGATNDVALWLHLRISSEADVELSIDANVEVATQADITAHDISMASHNGHFTDAVMHITATERTKWNNAATQADLVPFAQSIMALQDAIQPDTMWSSIAALTNPTKIIPLMPITTDLWAGNTSKTLPILDKSYAICQMGLTVNVWIKGSFTAAQLSGTGLPAGTYFINTEMLTKTNPTASDWAGNILQRTGTGIWKNPTVGTTITSIAPFFALTAVTLFQS
ncbi:MAG: phage tail protein [Oscillospiraceae bacterium]|jgi:hypothetical protein|nr:phage tail protein [Oscillospiraceae bacterium]